MIVLKFGGTSVEDGAAFARATEIIGTRRERQPVVVVSAMAGVTVLGQSSGGRSGRRQARMAPR